MTVFTRAWWHAAGSRAAATAIAVLLPVVGLLVSGDLELSTSLSMVATAALASLATSLAGLAEVSEKVVPLWRAVLTRTAKTLGQSLGSALVGVELLRDIDWNEAWLVVGAAVLTTLLRTLAAYLPETEPEPFAAERTVDGAYVITDLDEVDRSSLEHLRSTLREIDDRDPAVRAIDKVLPPPRH